jgi:hypothetical protein
MKRLVAVSLILIVSGAILFLAMRRPEPPPLAPVTVMPLPYRIPRQKASLFEVLVPQRPSWGWLWKLKETIAGRPKVFDLRGTIIKFEGPRASSLTDHLPPAPAFTTNGLSIWLLNKTECDDFNRNLGNQPGFTMVMGSPAITTADGMQATVTVGATYSIKGVPSTVGLSMDFLPRARGTLNDIITIMNLTETVTNGAAAAAGSTADGEVSVQTDLDVAARLQMPSGSGAFVLQDSPAATQSRRVGVLLSVSRSKLR